MKMEGSTDESSGVLHRTASLLNTSKFSDVEFIIECGSESIKFYAHKLILAMASQVFAKRFYGSSVSCLQIKVKNSSPSAFFRMLQYIYTDKLHVNSLKEALEIYTLATKYEIRELKEKCASFFQANVALDNLFIGYEYSLQDNIKELLDSCRNFVCSESKVVLESPHFKDASHIVIEDIVKQESLDVNSELDVINAVLKWARSECKRRSLPCDEMCLRDCIEPLLKHIRLLSLTPEEFFDFVEQHNIFTSMESSVLTRKLLEPNGNVHVPETFCLIAEKRKPKPIRLVRQESDRKENKMRTVDISTQLGIHQPIRKNGKITLLNTFGDQAFRAGPQLNHHVLNTYPDRHRTYEKEDKDVNKSIESGTHQFHRNNKIRYSYNFEDQTLRVTQEMKNHQTLNTSAFLFSKQKRIYDFPLSDVQNHIGSAFSNDVKCSARIRVVEGRISLHAIHLKLKNTKAEVDELEAHVCFSGFLEEPETQVYKEEIRNDIFCIDLSKPKVLQQGKTYEVEVTVEDIKLNRCSICRVKKCELNSGLDLNTEITLSSNQSYEDNYYFLISRFIYTI
ncbi:uncharacterized protein LOC118194535 [Stegodyphus dumicola]|uniref:uncharacterized protein LOC118194535 n=1 Tax=Stegodyphus dumicola TaxID=202533 RepID=UPI0015AAF81B|nr:uncharacterized protein LOC118194535 [Stegodyphus dumicola]